MTSWEATGPPGIDCVAPWTVVISWAPSKFCTTPCEISTTAPTIAIGSRIRTVLRTRSAQKFPIVSDSRRTNPRIRATAIAMPTAAETKFWTASPLIWTRWPIVDSPA